ncbi:MAG: hypothetical protein DRO00_04345 [Thermoproteota archaeon]|nr:MAG: hypothetical protein DRO00_04345 [Candidatus Korarchaeota archaeon]
MSSKKKPWLAALLNLVLPGLGFIYVGGLGWIVVGIVLIVFFWGLSPIAWFLVTGAGLKEISGWTVLALITGPLGVYAAGRKNKKMQELISPQLPRPETLQSLPSKGLEQDREEKLRKLEEALLDGKISEETYWELRRKYEQPQKEVEAEKLSLDPSGPKELKKCRKKGNEVSIVCPSCRKTTIIKTSAFTTDLEERSRMNLKETGESITLGRNLGWLLGFITAVFVAGGAYVFVGLLTKNTTIAYVLAVFLVLALARPIGYYITFQIFGREIPVWLFQCKNCGKNMILVSNGSETYLLMRK